MFLRGSSVPRNTIARPGPPFSRALRDLGRPLRRARGADGHAVRLDAQPLPDLAGRVVSTTRRCDRPVGRGRAPGPGSRAAFRAHPARDGSGSGGREWSRTRAASGCGDQQRRLGVDHVTRPGQPLDRRPFEPIPCPGQACTGMRRSTIRAEEDRLGRPRSRDPSRRWSAGRGRGSRAIGRSAPAPAHARTRRRRSAHVARGGSRADPHRRRGYHKRRQVLLVQYVDSP